MFYDIFVKSVIALIENHIHENLTVKEVASVTGFDPDYFRQVFKQATGQTLTRFIKARKLSHAAFLLKNSTRKVTDIALEYGFGSHDVFIRRFKEQYHMTPTDFRKSNVTVKGTPILPGVFVPTVIEREDNSMQENYQSEPFHGGLQMGEYQAKELAKKENRVQIVERILKAEELDRRAAAYIHKLLDDLAKGGD